MKKYIIRSITTGYLWDGVFLVDPAVSVSWVIYPERELAEMAALKDRLRDHWVEIVEIYKN
jgi:hypothetical protein